MLDLEQLTQEHAKALIALPSADELIRQPLLTREDILPHMDQLERTTIAFDGARKALLKKEIKGIDNPLYSIAFAVMTHDLMGPFVSLCQYPYLLRSYKQDSPDLAKIMRDEEMYLLYENTRVGLSMVPYMISGNKELLYRVMPLLNELTMNLLDHDQPIISIPFVQPQLSSDEYFAMTQLIKNAHKHKGPSQDPIIANAWEKDGYRSVIVHDFGSGIPADKLPEVFGSYSTTGSGLGLQMVKRLLDLRAGHAIIETSNGIETHAYSTKTNETSISAKNRPAGTTVSLNFLIG